LPRSPWRSLHRAKIVAKCDWRTQPEAREAEIRGSASLRWVGRLASERGSALADSSPALIWSREECFHNRSKRSGARACASAAKNSGCGVSAKNVICRVLCLGRSMNEKFASSRSFFSQTATARMARCDHSALPAADRASGRSDPAVLIRG
jgi:hypothetical protein